MQKTIGHITLQRLQELRKSVQYRRTIEQAANWQECFGDMQGATGMLDAAVATLQRLLAAELLYEECDYSDTELETIDFKTEGDQVRVFLNLEEECTNKLPSRVRFFGQTGHRSRHRRMTESDPERS
jgi:hypothetical protein